MRNAFIKKFGTSINWQLIMPKIRPGATGRYLCVIGAAKNRLKQEADAEILADEAEFKQIEEKMKKLPKKH